MWYIKIYIKYKMDNEMLMRNILNICIIIVFFGIVVMIYKIFFNRNINRKKYYESFVEDIRDVKDNKTIYEKSLYNIFENNKLMICNTIPEINKNTCIINGKPYVKYNCPVQMLKLPSGDILSVFNDGRLYKKDNMDNTMWQGPIKNSLPNDNIPLRMVTLKPDLITLLGIGYDNKLYIKNPIHNQLNLESYWNPVPNNLNIIYIIFDNESGYMISIDINGKLLIKTSDDLTGDNVELINKINRPILKMFYDLNGYMLILDNEFNLYQCSEINWKNSPINIERGYNNSKINDILYNNDGKMYGLIFDIKDNIIKLKKQNEIFYLSEFNDLSDIIKYNSEYVMSDLDIIKSKIGNINVYLMSVSEFDPADDDPNIAYQKQLLETKHNLIKFCSNRNNIINSNYDNYDLLANVDKNEQQIQTLKEIANNLISNEPDKTTLLNKFYHLK